MKGFKKFSILLILFLTTTYSYSNNHYKYIEIKIENGWCVLNLKDAVSFNEEEFKINEAIISEIIFGLENESQKIVCINLSNKNIDADIINLLTEGFKKILKRKLIRLELDLSKNKIDYNALKILFKALSSYELSYRFKLEEINLSNNQISGFLNDPESIEVLIEFLESRNHLEILNLGGNYNVITAEALFILFKGIMINRINLGILVLTHEKNDNEQTRKERSISRKKVKKIRKEFLSKVSIGEIENAKKFIERIILEDSPQ